MYVYIYIYIHMYIHICVYVESRRYVPVLAPALRREGPGRAEARLRTELLLHIGILLYSLYYDV